MQIRTGQAGRIKGALPADKKGAEPGEKRAPGRDGKFTVLFWKIILGENFRRRIFADEKEAGPLCKKGAGGRLQFFFKKIKRKKESGPEARKKEGGKPKTQVAQRLFKKAVGPPVSSKRGIPASLL